jgi:hypothetical protein
MIVMFEDPAGPIERFEWGRYQINGQAHSEDGEGVGKDVCILDGKVMAWAAREGHKLKPGMIRMVLDHDVDILVIGVGVNGRIKVPEKTIEKAHKDGITEVIVEKTPDACRIYNDLVKSGKRVAFLAHGTC